MAAKKSTGAIERVYNVPLRKEFQKVSRWKKTRKAVFALRSFLEKHMKSDDIKLSRELNEKLWKNGIKNPPHHVKISVTRDDKGMVRAELFEAKKVVKEEKKTAKKETLKKEVAKENKEKVKVEAQRSEPSNVSKAKLSAEPKGQNKE